VIETLRLFPVALTTRSGSRNISITMPDGTVYPTANFMIWVNIHTIHRRPDLFPSPDEFIPERFLEQEIPKDAWRPFEKGPRSCIGQELALLEMKTVLALTIRDFEVRSAYEEWDRKMGREKPGEMLDGRRGMFGESCYFDAAFATALCEICDEI
jgi:cytochrome P450